MTTRARTAILAAALVVTVARPVCAGPSAITDAFIAGIQSGDVFLAASGELALRRSRDRSVDRTAKADLALSAQLDAALSTWSRAVSREQTTDNDYPLVGGSSGALGDALSLPITLGNRVTEAGTRAVDQLIAASQASNPSGLAGVAPDPVPLGHPFRPAERAAYDRLRAVDANAFAAQFRADRRAVLVRMTGLLRDYIKNGDETGLRAVAVRFYPKISAMLPEPDRG